MALTQVFQALAFDMIGNLEEDQVLDPENLHFLARSIKDIAAAQKSDTDRALTIRRGLGELAPDRQGAVGVALLGGGDVLDGPGQEMEVLGIEHLVLLQVADHVEGQGLEDLGQGHQPFAVGDLGAHVRHQAVSDLLGPAAAQGQGFDPLGVAADRRARGRIVAELLQVVDDLVEREAPLA